MSREDQPKWKTEPRDFPTGHPGRLEDDKSRPPWVIEIPTSSELVRLSIQAIVDDGNFWRGGLAIIAARGSFKYSSPAIGAVARPFPTRCECILFQAKLLQSQLRAELEHGAFKKVNLRRAAIYAIAEVEDFRTDRRCRVCGCTEFDCSYCVNRTGEPCHWVESDLCSACVGTEAQPAAASKSKPKATR